MLNDKVAPNGPSSPGSLAVNILIVDDELRNLTVLESVLEDPAYRVVRCASADEALLALVSEEFALLILDVNMPGMSGFELAQTIRARRRNAHVPIIFLTAYYTDDEHVLEGYGTGAVDYLHKPVNPVVLRSKVSVFVDLYRKTRELEKTNQALLAEVSTRRKVEADLSILNETLERRVAERTAALRYSEELFRQLADSMPQMVWTANAEGFLDYYNARWRQFSGILKTDGDIKNWAPLLHPDDYANCCENWYAAVSGQQSYRDEFRLWDERSQRYIWYLGRALPVRTDDGEIVRWIGTCTDIDDQKRLEADLRRANYALEEFAFAASHDLQEPLRNVSIYAELLRTRFAASLSGDAGTFLGIVVEGARRMGRLVGSLLEYTQSTRTGERSPVPVDVEKVFGRVLQNLATAVEESKATIISRGLPTIAVEEVHMEQLLQNLIGNALKYRSEGVAPEVCVSAFFRDSEWHFAVKDNGIGIAPQYHQRVFRIFKRLHTDSEKYSGTGIGLAICQRIVENYGGRIWVESGPGQGSTFRFTVPRV